MAEEVKSVERATEIAYTYLRRYFSPLYELKPAKVVRENDIWLVEFDVGLLIAKIAKVKINAKSGDILEYIAPT